MEIIVSRIWSTPSTLHLRCVVKYKSHEGVQFSDIHIPLRDMPEELREHLLAFSGPDGPREPVPGLW